MLQTLIKRSGVREPFSIVKSNKWGLWGARGVEDRLDWASVVIRARESAPAEMTSQDWQKFLIERLKARGTQSDGWPYMLVAGRLYTVWMLKHLHGDDYPHLRDQLKNTYEAGLARKLNYSETEIEFLNDFVLNHDLNFEMAYYQVEQYYQKYGLMNRATGECYETPQFTIMRMAMAVYEHHPEHQRLDKVADLYRDLSQDLLNPPTPNYSSLGTDHYGMASCCLIAIEDDAESIMVGGMISYAMTLASSGLGVHLDVRAPGDPVDGGRVPHGGRLNYIRKLVGDCTANKQGMRGGALNVYGTVYDPEIETMAKLQNPRTPIQVRERLVNITYQTNPFFIRKAAKREMYFTFTSFSAPDLYKAFFLADQTLFEELYAKYEADPTFKKQYRDAYETAVMLVSQEMEVSTLFWNCPATMNRHTPFKSTLIQSNLCVEVMVPVTPFRKVLDLFGDGDPKNGETGICNIGSIPVHNFEFDIDDPMIGYERYKRAVRSQLEMIDYAIDHSEYHYPAIARQAKARRNASVGMSGIATLMARLNLKFNTAEGRKAIHRLAERHAFACAEVALDMGRERGNAEWMHDTKWPDGWLVIDTYKREIDQEVDNTLFFPWERLRKQIMDNKGIRFSCLVAHMPGEQATRKGTGSNSIYPLFRLSTDLTDGSSTIPWAALDNDLIGDQYQLAWENSQKDIAIHYGIIQKFTDQGGSFDEYINRVECHNPSADSLVQRLIWRQRYGHKSKYYTRSLTTQGGQQKDIKVSDPEPTIEEISGASCTLDGACGT